jgi:hypothetical protein
MSGTYIFVVSVYALKLPVKMKLQGAVPVVELTLSNKALVDGVLIGLVELSLQEKEIIMQTNNIITFINFIFTSIVIFCAG